MARSNRVKLQALKQTLEMLRLTDSPEQLPTVVQEMIKQIAVPNVVIAFAFQPLTGNLVNISTSALPPKPEAYSQVANAASRVAQIFQNKAMEVMQSVTVATKERMDGVETPYPSPESRDGVGKETVMDTPDSSIGESVPADGPSKIIPITEGK